MSRRAGPRASGAGPVGLRIDAYRRVSMSVDARGNETVPA